jgi:AraC family transcriptional regulator
MQMETFPVQIVDFPETKVAAYEHRGDPGRLGESIREFVEWRKAHGLPPASSATFNLVYGNPLQGKPEDFRIDLCVATERDLSADTSGLVSKIIAPGRCARVRHIGTDDTLGVTLETLYSGWLPQSGETLRDFPLFFQRVSFAPFVPAHEAITDIHLPLA